MTTFHASFSDDRQARICYNNFTVMKRGKNGTSLIEAVITAALIAIIFIPVTTLFPVATLARKSAENKQTATYLAKAYLEEVKSLVLPSLPDSFTGGKLELDKDNYWVTIGEPFTDQRTLNKVNFTIERRIWVIKGERKHPPALVDVMVTVSYPTVVTPIVLSSRFFMGQ